MKTAIVIGATGLVGKAVVLQLLEDLTYGRVVALVRRKTPLEHPRYEEHVVDFERPESFADRVRGDVLYSAMGTTRGQAGSVAAQRKVDYAYQLEVARLAAKAGVPTYVLISSSGANPGSVSAYWKMKGELERDVKTLGFSSLQILQPGPLSGAREKPRLGEEVAQKVVGAFNRLGVLRSMRPISGEQVARAMRHAATLSGSRTHGPAELFTLG